MTKSRPWPVIGRTIFFTSDKNRPTNQKPAITHRDEIYFIDFWRENLSMYRIKLFLLPNLFFGYLLKVEYYDLYDVFFLFFFEKAFFFFFLFQDNFIEHTHVQLTFTKDNLQQNENYNLKLTKKKPNTIKT